MLNPRWVLVELLQVLTDWHHGKIKAFEKTIKPVIFERLKIIKDDHILEFKPVDPKYYKELLRSTTDKNYHLLLFATKILIDENQNFSEKLFSGIEAEINRLNTEELEVAKLKTLSKYLGYIATELINQGYSKGYLYSITSRIFSEGRPFDFNQAFEEFKSAINREEEEFTVVYKCFIHPMVVIKIMKNCMDFF